MTLIGGEAYLRKDWTIVRSHPSARDGMTMVTGGRGFTPERARAAEGRGRDERLVSIDGWPTHDALRGMRQHAAACAMRNLAREGVQVSANTQIGRRNRRELGGIFEEDRRRGRALLAASNNVAGGRAADDPSLLLEPYHLIEVMPASPGSRRDADAVDVRIWPGNNLGYYGPFEALFAASSPGGRGSCGAGRSASASSRTGGQGCPSLPSAAYVGGNVRDDRLRDVWERAEPLRFTRRDAGRSSGAMRGSYYADDCLGGCSWTAHSLFGGAGTTLLPPRALDLLRRGGASGSCGWPRPRGALRSRALRDRGGGLAADGARARACRGRGQ